MKLQINITQAILTQTKDCTPFTGDLGTGCAIAEAVRGIFPHAVVAADVIRFTEPDPKGIMDFNLKHEEILLPLSAQLFIIDFDKKLAHERVQMKPFSFEVIVPDSILEQIDISEIEEVLQSSKTLQLI